MDRWQGKTAIVTGASAGIGTAIVENLVANGLHVVGLARRLDRLEELKNRLNGKKGKFYPLKCDVTKEEDILSVFKWVEDHLKEVHVLVNNAGTAVNTTHLEETETSVWREIYDVNILGLQICSREAIKSMRKHDIKGQIVNISSVAAHMSSPIFGMTSYFASKKAVNMISEGLRVELNKSGIKVTTISPGYVKTEFFDVSGIKVPAGLPGLEPKDIATTVEFLLTLPPHVLVTELVVRDVVDGLGDFAAINK